MRIPALPVLAFLSICPIDARKIERRTIGTFIACLGNAGHAKRLGRYRAAPNRPCRREMDAQIRAVHFLCNRCRACFCAGSSIPLTAKGFGRSGLRVALYGLRSGCPVIEGTFPFYVRLLQIRLLRREIPAALFICRNPPYVCLPKLIWRTIHPVHGGGKADRQTAN